MTSRTLGLISYDMWGKDSLRPMLNSCLILNDFNAKNIWKILSVWSGKIVVSFWMRLFIDKQPKWSSSSFPKVDSCKISFIEMTETIMSKKPKEMIIKKRGWVTLVKDITFLKIVGYFTHNEDQVLNCLVLGFMNMTLISLPLVILRLFELFNQGLLKSTP